MIEVASGPTIHIPVVNYGSDSVSTKKGQYKDISLGDDGVLFATWDIVLEEVDKDKSELFGKTMLIDRKYSERHIIPCRHISRIFLGLNNKYNVWSLEIWQYTGDSDGPCLIYGFDEEVLANAVFEKVYLWYKKHINK